MRICKSWFTVLAFGIALGTASISTRTTFAAPEENTPSAVKSEANPDAIKESGFEGGESHKHGILDVEPGTAVFTILVFLALLAILYPTAWKQILNGLKKREQSIRDSIEAAAKAREDTAKTTKELEAKIAEAQRQGALALAQAKQDAQKLADGIKAQAEAESSALKDRTLRDIEAAKQQAIAEINNHAADIGTQIASKLLQRNITVADQDRLVQESLAELKVTNN